FLGRDRIIFCVASVGCFTRQTLGRVYTRRHVIRNMGRRTMCADQGNGRRSRLGICFGVLAVALGTASMVPGSRAAEPVAAATTVSADFCKTPSSRPGLVPGFTLLCGKRIPAGAFLGSFLSPTDDAVGDCVKRCAADSRCRAFSLDAREPPSGRVCTLYG